MSLRSKLWGIASDIYPAFLRVRYGMHLGKGVRIAHGAHLDKSINPKGIYIGDQTWVLNGAFVMAHDHCRSIKADTRIGNNCVIGINSIIMPGITIGDEVVVGAGAIVTKDIPGHSMVAGNPAKILKEGIHVTNGKIIE